MAATTRAASTEPFPPLNTSPRTPTTLAAKVATSQPGGGNTTSPKLNQANLSPRALTGVAAAAENRKRQQREAQMAAARDTSPNPAVQALQTLIGGGGVSRPSDAPDPSKVSEPLQSAAEKMRIVTDGAQENPMQVSPVSMSSFGTLDSGANSSAMTATTTGTTSGPQFVAEPAQMMDAPTYHHGNGQPDTTHDQEGPKAFSYPGPPPQEQGQEARPSRGMSLPGYGQNSPKSPASNKRHKCPYCSTDFTRHHNLKSHLLTHSQEKPYVCDTCQARFRRLHDLKRHSKLHTGERPHTCNQCGRKFARGDALARHNKGPGGCAGRRSSFGADDEFGPDGEGMDGVEYEDEGSSPDQGRRVSEPSRKRTHLETPDDPRRQVYRQHSSTYPPPYQQPGRPHVDSVGSMGPPQTVPGQSSTNSPRQLNLPAPQSAYFNNSSGQVFPHTGIIASPTPLSPGQAPDQPRSSVGDASMSGTRNRSPSVTTQFQQLGRGMDGRTPPAPPSQYTSSHHGPHGAPVLPPPNQTSRPGMPPTTLSAGPGPSMLHQHSIPPSGSNAQQGSNPGSLSSHGRSSGSSIRDVLGVGPDQNELWQTVRKLEQRLSRMQDEYELRISRLQEEVISLREQLSSATSGPGPYGSDARY